MVFDYQKYLDLGWRLCGGGIITNMITKIYHVACPYCKDRNYVELEIDISQGFHSESDGHQCDSCNFWFPIEYSSEIIIVANPAA